VVNTLNFSKLLITGSNGFVGSSILDHLSDIQDSLELERVYLVNRSKPKVTTDKYFKGIPIENITFDLEKSWDFDVSECAVINLAADGSANSYSDSAAKNFEAIGGNLISWCVRNKPKVVFHASSGAVSGIKYITDETSEWVSGESLNIKTRFIKSRTAIEHQLENLCENQETSLVIGNLYSFVGKNLLKKKQYALSQFIHGAINEGKIVVTGNPATTRSYLNERDMARWIVTALNSERSLTKLNIGSSFPVRIQELAELIASLTGSTIEYSNPHNVADVYLADNRETLDILRERETIGWQDSVRDLVSVLRGE
jgi:nucleoside-diphosphate-sugar epimerase